MAPPVILSLFFAVATASDAVWHLWAHDPKGAKKLFAYTYLFGGVGFWIFIAAWNSPNPNIWWGNGCTIRAEMWGMCSPLVKLHGPVAGQTPIQPGQP
jgi:hypothetical protein